MTNEELVKALRGKFIAYDATGNHKSAQLYKDAAAAIEELQDEMKRLEPKRGDLVEVVLCKDCKWNISCGYISLKPYKEWKDWFCADGERGN